MEGRGTEGFCSVGGTVLEGTWMEEFGSKKGQL